MERINELMSKYFDGRTSREEEQVLKEYFAGKSVDSELEMYVPLFKTFHQEKLTKMEADVKLPVSSSTKRKYWIRTFAVSGIAAALALIFWLQIKPLDENYAVVNGQRINDEQYACQLAEAKLRKASEMLGKNLEPINSIEKVRTSLQPLQKIADTMPLKNEE